MFKSPEPGPCAWLEGRDLINCTNNAAVHIYNKYTIHIKCVYNKPTLHIQYIYNTFIIRAMKKK